MKQKRNKILLYITTCLLFMLVVFILFIEIQFKNIKQDSFAQSNNKHWSHRGYAETKNKENTLAAISMALQNGYEGVEIDLWYKNGQFYVSHDENYADSLPKLKDVFRIFHESYFWLDLKNLSYSNYKEIAKHLEKLNKDKNSYLIESKNSLYLGFLHKGGFQTSYWLINGSFIRQFIQKVWIVFFEYNGISMPAKSYQKKGMREKYKHLNIHLWENHPKPEIYEWEEIKIILDDNEVKMN